MISPLTYWVWRTVAEHGPVSTDRLRELLPEMPHDRLSARLFNLRASGYISAARPTGRYAVFTKTSRAPDDVDGLEQLLAANVVFQGKAEEAAPVQRPRRANDDAEPSAPLIVQPFPQPSAPRNPWPATSLAFGERPPVVRAGSLDALRLASRQFGRNHQVAERSLGVVEAGGRHA